MNSYNKLTHILVLIEDLYLFRSPVGVTELIPVLIADLYLFRSLVGVTELILVRSTRRYYRAYTCTEVPVGTTELILVQRYP